MRTAIVNLKTIVTGDWRKPFAKGDSILMGDGKFEKIGTLSAREVDSCDLVLDGAGMTAMPGLIDSQVHITFGDYTPRQRTVGFIESYLHGGVTTSLSASEVHVPGRPSDPDGVVALAVAAMKCFEHYRPGGAKVYAGCVILEPGMKQAHFDEARRKGIWFAKAGFGKVATPFDYAPLVKMAHKAGMIVNCHTGGASIPDSSPITADHLLAMKADVSFHVNGGPVAMPDRDFERLVRGSKIALQVCQAGNIRTALMCLDLAVKHEQFDRFLIATDTPTGTGVMPLGMIKSICELSTLSKYPPEWLVCAATGNVSATYNIPEGFIQKGKPADVIVCDAPLGGSKSTALDAIKHGDIVGIAACFTQGVPRFIGRSRNTPPATRKVRIAKNKVFNTFAPIGHV